MYDFLIVGAGLFGSVCAYELNKLGYKVLVIDKRNHVGGNVYTENINGIDVHKYGAHIFHTSDKKVWNYINQFCNFNNYINEPIANYKGEIYNLPFNMNTFSKMWDIVTPEQAKKKIEQEKKESNINIPTNLEEQAISLVGKTIYQKLIKGYTEKQWGKPCKELPVDIIKRLPVRYTYNNNYFNDMYQGIPINGYTYIIEKMLKNIDIKLNCNYLENKNELNKMANRIIFTGTIDSFYDYCFGELEYRSLQFQDKYLDIENYQGNAVINYTDDITPYTRTIEHKHFNNKNIGHTIITYEYPLKWDKNKEPYYPINNKQNNELYKKYKGISNKEENVIFGGRLGLYEYLDMDKTIIMALQLIDNIKR